MPLWRVIYKWTYCPWFIARFSARIRYRIICLKNWNRKILDLNYLQRDTAGGGFGDDDNFFFIYESLSLTDVKIFKWNTLLCTRNVMNLIDKEWNVRKVTNNKKTRLKQPDHFRFELRVSSGLTIRRHSPVHPIRQLFDQGCWAEVGCRSNWFAPRELALTWLNSILTTITAVLLWKPSWRLSWVSKDLSFRPLLNIKANSSIV